MVSASSIVSKAPPLLLPSTSELHPGGLQHVLGKERMGKRWREGHWLLSRPEVLPPCLCSGSLPLAALQGLRLMPFSEIPPLGSVSLPKIQPHPVVHSLNKHGLCIYKVPGAGVQEYISQVRGLP